MIEYERRYRISVEDFARLQSSPDLSWSPPARLTDVTFGLSGAESMQIDGWVIRLRRSAGSVALQYKAPVNPEWTAWREISLTVDNAATAIQFLRAIGLKTGLLLDRTRSIASCGKYIISLDEFALLGQFVEIELNSTFRSESTPNFDEIVEQLGLQTAAESVPYGQLMLQRLKDDPELIDQVGKYLESI
jgi:predicted adenylyl cyclase CyaB